VIVKPHAVTEGNAGAIVDAIQERYRVTAAQLFTLERQNAQEFFEVYKGVVAPAEYSGMVEHLTSGLFLGAPPAHSHLTLTRATHVVGFVP